MTDENKPVSKKPLRASKAPPSPEIMLRGSGRISSVFRTKPNRALPNWAKWKYMPEVELWQACALALNFDPDSMSRSPDNWMARGADIFLPESFPSDEVAGEFKNLREIAKANKLQTIHFTINLPEFAAWCAPVVRDLTGRDIPLDLAALAKAAAQAAPKGEAVAGTTPGDDWKEQARAIADECFDHDTKLNCRDSLKGYSRRVMDIMQERGIKGVHGIIDNANYVMREALQSDKWWKNKSK